MRHMSVCVIDGNDNSLNKILFSVRSFWLPVWDHLLPALDLRSAHKVFIILTDTIRISLQNIFESLIMKMLLATCKNLTGCHKDTFLWACRLYRCIDATRNQVSKILLRNNCLLISWMLVTIALSAKYIWVVVTHDWSALEVRNPVPIQVWVSSFRPSTT